MKITTAWTDNGDDGINLVSAYTDADLDNWGGKIPDFHKQAIAHTDEPVRELMIEVADAVIENLFKPAVVTGKVAES